MNQKWTQFVEIIKRKKVSIVLLDKSWHDLFVRFKKPLSVKLLEGQLKRLVKQQGQANVDLLRYKEKKAQLLATIVEGMGDAINKEDSKAFNKMNTKGKAIEEIKKRIDKIESQLNVLPDEINDANIQVLTASMTLCLDDVIAKKKKYKALSLELEKLKEKIKEIASDKAEIKEQYQLAYAYMHDTFGKEAIDVLDFVFEEELSD